MKSLYKTFSLIISTLLIATLSYVVYNRRLVLDEILLLNYTPSQQIEKLASESGMNDKARKVFYVHKPLLLDRDTFNSYCTDEEETIVLGCYDGQRIYVFNVDNDQLSGIEEVTAAHEMLHAQYERLSNNERSKVNSLLEKQLSMLTDQRILKNIEAYRKKDPSIVLNEAHSIFATELEAIEPALEQYYSQYFVDRQKVVRLSASYETVLTSLKNQVAEIDAKLTELKAVIENLERDLAKRADELTVWSSRLDSLRNQGNVAEYNSQVYSYNSSVENYRNDVAQLRSRIAEYNGMIESRNNLALQQNTLFKSIDSKAKEL